MLSNGTSKLLASCPETLAFLTFEALQGHITACDSHDMTMGSPQRCEGFDTAYNGMFETGEVGRRAAPSRTYHA